MKKYTLGLDLGISSVGWALMLQNEDGSFKRIEDCGVRIFDTVDSQKDGTLANQDRRAKRGARRLRRRKQNRLLDYKKYLLKKQNLDFNCIDYDSIIKKYNDNELIKYLPYFLKVRGLTEQLTKEELAIAVYHYIKYRGFKSNRKNLNQTVGGSI